PLDDVALGVAGAVDVALLVDLVATGLDHFGGDGQVACGQDDAVKGEFQVALANEVAGLLVGFQVSTQHAAPGKDGVAELLHGSELTKDRITNCGSGRREIRLAQGALKKSTGGH